MARAWRSPEAAIFAAAIVPRLAVLLQLRAHSPTFWRPEGGDSILYDRIASGAFEPLRAYFHSPLYIGFLSALYRIFGRDLFMVRLVQHALGAAACVLVYRITRRVFHSHATAMLAGLLAAISGPVLFYEAQIGVDALMPFLTLACVALVLRASRTRAPRDWAFVGMAIGVAALGRAVVLLWAPMVLAWAIGRERHSIRWRRGGAVALGLALVIAPVTARNYAAEHDLVLITANGGLNLYIGNHPSADGAYVFPRGLDFRAGDPAEDFEGRRAAEEDEGRALTSAEVSAWWSKRAVTFLRASPGRALWLVREKILLLVSHRERMQLHDYDVYREVAPVLGALPMAAVIVVPGVAGAIAVALSRRRRPLARRAALLALAFAAGFLPFFVVGRYRAPWLLMLAPFAAWWMVAIARSIRARTWRYAIPLAAGASAMIWLSTRSVAPPPSVGFQYMAFARASLAGGDRPAALHWAARSVDRDPSWTEGVALLARFRREDGRYDDANRALDAGLARTPDASALWLERGRTELARGHLAEAVTALATSVDDDPRSDDAWSALSGALRMSGRLDDARVARRSLDVVRRATP